MGLLKKARNFAKQTVKTVYNSGENIISGGFKTAEGLAELDLSKAGKGLAETAGGVAGVMPQTMLLNIASGGGFEKAVEGVTNYATLNFNAGSRNITDSRILGDDPLRVKEKDAARAAMSAEVLESKNLASIAEKNALAKERASLLMLRKQVGIGTKKIGTSSIGGGSSESSAISQGIILG